MSRLLLPVVLLLGAACNDPRSPPPADDELILELGGNHKRLADSLRKVGGDRQLPQDPPAEPPTEPPPEPPPKPPPEPARWVELGAGQTISAIAREQLGDVNRWREILQANGWTEGQARRLRPGTRVKLPH